MSVLRLRRPTVAAAVIVAVSGIGLTSGVAAAGSAGHGRPATAPRWRIIATAPGELTSIVAPDVATQWAFGGQYSLAKPKPPIALRQAGSRWIQAAMPRAADGDINCASATTPRDIWAFDGEMFGPFAPDATAALRLRAGRWSIGQSFSASSSEVGFVTDCHVLSPTNVWAFGSTGAGPAIGTWHLQGSRWTHMKTYPAYFLGQASVISPSSIWATGWDGVEGLLAHWNGRSWKADPSLLAALPKPSSTVQVAVSMVNAIRSSDLWVEALVSREGKGGAVHSAPQVVHWNGRTWSAVTRSQFGYYLPVAVRDGRGGWWSTGYPDVSRRTSMTSLLHNARGRWVKVALPAVPVGDILQVTEPVSVPGTRTSYAVGNVIKLATGFGHGVILKITY